MTEPAPAPALLRFPGSPFQLHQPFPPAGEQPEAIDRLVEGVRAIASQPGQREVMGQRARQFAETQTWPAIMDELIDCYTDLIAGRRPSL